MDPILFLLVALLLVITWVLVMTVLGLIVGHRLGEAEVALRQGRLERALDGFRKVALASLQDPLWGLKLRKTSVTPFDRALSGIERTYLKSERQVSLDEIRGLYVDWRELHKNPNYRIWHFPNLYFGQLTEVGLKTQKRIREKATEAFAELPRLREPRFAQDDRKGDKKMSETAKGAARQKAIGTNARKSQEASMFAESDYGRFMAGVFVVGGLVVLPLTYGQAVGLGYLASLPWSLASCAVFLIAFRRNGTISWARTIPAIIAIVVAGNVYNQATGNPAFGAGGMLGFLLVMICGYIGIGIGRLLGLEKR